MTARYQVRATDPKTGEQYFAGADDDMTGANRIMLRALHDGAPYAHITDTGQDKAPYPVTDAEREALAAIMPKMPRTME